MANYLINQDYIYLFSAILSLFTDPLNGLPSFDKYFTESANSPFPIDLRNINIQIFWKVFKDYSLSLWE